MGDSAARPSGCLPRLVLGDGGVDFRFLDLVGRSAVSEGREHAVLIQGDHHGCLAAEVDDVVTAAVLFWPCTHKDDANPDALRGQVLTRLCGTPVSADRRLCAGRRWLTRVVGNVQNIPF
jgi:hypothetical protein